MIARLAVTATAALVLTLDFAAAACGDRSGPGYRGPNGKCVGWAELGRVCGNPPTSRCSPENVTAGSDKAADHGTKIQSLRTSVPVK